MVGTVQDVTARVDTEAELRDADRRKDHFIAVLAHELRNPLAPIRTGLEILRRAGDNRALAERTHATMAARSS